jgi:hypothetical protein
MDHPPKTSSIWLVAKYYVNKPPRPDGLLETGGETIRIETRSWHDMALPSIQLWSQTWIPHCLVYRGFAFADKIELINQQPIL